MTGVESRAMRIKGPIRHALLAKSREAALTAVQTYNNPLVKFKSETYIVLMTIAWTYLMHAYYAREDVDIRYLDKDPGSTFATAASGSGLSKRYVPFVSLTCSSITTTRFIAASSTVASVPTQRSVPGPGTLRWPSVPIPCPLGDSRGSTLVRPLRRCCAGAGRPMPCIRPGARSRRCGHRAVRPMLPELLAFSRDPSIAPEDGAS